MATANPSAPAAPAAASAGAATSPSVYVGNLDPRVTEAMLYEHFRTVGPVVSVRVCIDSSSQKSLGYGYVNYQGAADADRAIDQLNGSRLADRVINVARVLRDPTLRKSGVTNIVVKGLPADADAKAIKELFSRLGTIVSIKIATDDTGKPRGLAYIMYDREQSAAQAVQDFNGQRLSEDASQAPLVVERYRTPAAQAAEAAQKFTNLYIRNLKDTVTDAQLLEAFQPFGKITSAKVRQDPNAADGKNLGFGWVAFETHESAVAASEALNEKDHALAAEGQTLGVRRFMNKKERSRLRELKHRERIAAFSKYPNLYVKNFDDSVNEDRLKALFERFGATHSVKIAMDRVTKASRGFAFVSFLESSHAQKALSELAGSRELGERPLYVVYAQRRDVRRQQQEELARRRRERPFGMGGMGGPGMFPGAPGGPMGFPGMMPGMFGAGPMGIPPMQMQAFRGAQSLGPMMGMRPQMPMPMPMGPHGGMMGGFPPNLPPGMPMGGPGGYAPRPPMPVAAQPPRPAAPVAPAARPPQPAQQSGLDPSVLASMTPEQAKNVLGERLYSYIYRMDAQHAAKITGMLLEIDNYEILNLLDSPDQLNAKVREAQEVLARHGSA